MNCAVHWRAASVASPPRASSLTPHPAKDAGINLLGLNGTSGFDEAAVISESFFQQSSFAAQFACSVPSSTPITQCREYFPRLVGDVNGDGLADFLGFRNTEAPVLQFAPSVTQPR